LLAVIVALPPVLMMLESALPERLKLLMVRLRWFKSKVPPLTTMLLVDLIAPATPNFKVPVLTVVVPV